MASLYELPQHFVDAVVANDVEQISNCLETLPDNDRPGLLTVALSVAIVRGAKDATNWLLDHGADPNLPVDREGKTPLHRAAGYGISWAVDLLLQRGADPNRQSWGNSSLHEAIRGGHVGVVKKLLAAGADPNGQLRAESPLRIACELGHASIVAALIKAHADVNPPKRKGLPQDTPLHHAARGGIATCVELLLKQGADPLAKGAYGKLAIEVAAKAGHPDIVKMLEAAGGPEGRASSNEIEIAETLSESRAAVKSVNSRVSHLIERSLTGSKIHDAAALGQADKVQLALNAGVHADAQDRYGFSPLHKAAQFGHLEVIRLLAASGANLNIVAKTRAAATPLHYAAGYGQPDAVKLLLSLGADPSITDGSGQRAVDWATSSRSYAAHRDANAESAKLLGATAIRPA